MARAKTEVDQLRGILDQFDDNVVRELFTKRQEGAGSHLRTKDLDDGDQSIPVGQDRHVAYSEIEKVERIIDEADFLPAHFLEEGAATQRAVARIALRVAHAGLPAGNGWGTGFMVSPSLLMTNNHVIPTKSFADKVRAEFNYQLDMDGSAETPDRYNFNEDNFFYTNAALDFTIIRVKAKPLFATHLTAVPTVNAGALRRDAMTAAVNNEAIARSLTSTHINTNLVPFFPRIPGNIWGWIPLDDGQFYALGEHLNVIQHPRGRRKEIALQDNVIDDVRTNHVRYTSDTEPGSSGSPVFDNSWDIVALHHAGGEFSNGKWVNNQGVRMDRIVAHLKSNLAGNPVLNELGLN